MRICYIITALGYGGAEKLLVEIGNRLTKGNEITIIYLKKYELLLNQFSNKITFIYIPLNAFTAYRIRKFLKKEKPDILHTNLGHADIFGLYSSRGLKMKRFCTMHNIWFKFSWIDKVIFFLYRLILSRVDTTVICISTSVQEHVRKVLKVTDDKSPLLYNAIPEVVLNPNNVSELKQKGIYDDRFNILFVGRLEKQKSLTTLLKAYSILNDSIIEKSRLIIVGEGSEEQKLKEYAKKLGILNHTFFLGSHPNPEIFYDNADLFILPSIFEGFGIVIIEAYRAGVPVIASNIEGPKELVQNGQNGYLVEPLNAEKFADKIALLFSDDMQLKELSKNARKSYKEEFEMDNYIVTLLGLYQNSN